MRSACQGRGWYEKFLGTRAGGFSEPDRKPLGSDRKPLGSDKERSGPGRELLDSDREPLATDKTLWALTRKAFGAGPETVGLGANMQVTAFTIPLTSSMCQKSPTVATFVLKQKLNTCKT